MIPPKDQRMDKPLTMHDLYGKSDSEESDGLLPGEEGKPKGQIMFNKHNEALVYEETPEIAPIPEESPVTPETDMPHEQLQSPPDQMYQESYKPEPQPESPQMPHAPAIAHHTKRKSSRIGSIFMFLFFVVLGIAGVYFWQTGSITQILRQESILPSPIPTNKDINIVSIPVGPENQPTASPPPAGVPTATITPTLLPSQIPPTPLPSATPEPTSVAAKTYPGWTTVPLGNGINFPVPAISLQMPPDVKPLSCDPPGCSSQGTELVGKTRFTVSFHRFSKPIVNFDKAKITDATGRVFPNITFTHISGKPALNYSGSFNGTTTNGFGFTQMHGVMILLDPQTTLETNHFAPTGATTDFGADDTTFNQIVTTINIH